MMLMREPQRPYFVERFEIVASPGKPLPEDKYERLEFREFGLDRTIPVPSLHDAGIREEFEGIYNILRPLAQVDDCFILYRPEN